ncbi:MAG TPA: hypothetical protein VNA25_14520 [Phycisphaerae bacterium]|nr:hypothetical protein [Phycisphaerae bacterium]
MSENTEPTDPKLEAMLRRWGAEESARRTQAGPSPWARRPARRAGTIRWQWALVTAAAAAVLVVGVVAVTMMVAPARQMADRGPAASEQGYAPGPAEKGRLKQLQERNAELEKDLKDLREAQTQLALRMEEKLAALRQDANAARADLSAELLRSVAVKADLEGKRAELEQLKTDLNTLAARLDQESQKVRTAETRATKAEQRLTSAAEEVQRVRKLHEQALAQSKQIQSELDAMSARQVAFWRQFERSYLEAAAPGQTGYAALQTAVKRSRLVERCGQLRGRADEPTRSLLDKLEVVLTRLEMVEPGHFVSEDLFRSLLQKSDVVSQIDAALKSDSLSAPEQALLFEARLILNGAKRVG